MAEIFPALRMEFTCINKDDEYYRNKSLQGKVSFDEGDERIDLDLYGYYSVLCIQTTGPYRGIVSRAPFITYFADPMSNGYMDKHCLLTEKGYYHLSLLLRQVINIHRLVKEFPNAALEMYAAYHSRIAQKDSGARFGALKVGPETPLTRSLAARVRNHYGLEPPWSPDLVRSLEAIVVNHPNLFSGKWN